MNTEEIITNKEEIVTSKPKTKKRQRDEIQGDIITQEELKRILLNPLEGMEIDEEGEEDDEWVVNSNQVTVLRLETDMSSLGSNEYAFAPEFTNQVYKQEEEIYGYKDLEVNIRLLGGSLHAYLELKFSDKTPDADPIKELLTTQVFLQGFLSRKEYMEKLKNECEFRPLGKKLYEYELLETPDQTYEIYHCKFSTEGFIEYNERLQVFVKFFIDGASFIENTDFWDYYILYKKDQKGAYTFCGYCTTYSFYQSVVRKRVRISQFIILPPFQRKSHGSSLLKVVYSQIIKDEECFEMSVEDSSLEFQHLRDLSDTRWCLSKGYFPWALKYFRQKITFEEYKAIKLSTGEIKAIQKDLKLTKNQIKRVFEMFKLAIGDMENPEFFTQYKNEIKTRLYLANRTEFLPFLKKKYPLIDIDGEVEKVPLDAFTKENMPKEEVEERLQEYWQEIYDQYNAILKKVDLVLESMSIPNTQS